MLCIWQECLNSVVKITKSYLFLKTREVLHRSPLHLLFSFLLVVNIVLYHTSEQTQDVCVTFLNKITNYLVTFSDLLDLSFFCTYLLTYLSPCWPTSAGGAGGPAGGGQQGGHQEAGGRGQEAGGRGQEPQVHRDEDHQQTGEVATECKGVQGQEETQISGKQALGNTDVALLDPLSQLVSLLEFCDGPLK